MGVAADILYFGITNRSEYLSMGTEHPYAPPPTLIKMQSSRL
jgi:hypothetical protein